MTSLTNHNPGVTDLLVVGGGLAGLTAAALAARAGRTVTVLEQADHLGGRAATHVRNGVHFNLGAHALYAGGHAIRLFRELGVPFTGHPPVTGGALAFVGDTPYGLPRDLRSLLTTRLLSLREKWRLLHIQGALSRTDTRGLGHVTLADWIARTAGTGRLADLLRAFFRTATYADDPERTSAAAAIAQFQTASAGVLYLDGGWQTLADGLRACAAGHGAEVRTGAVARSVSSGEQGVAVQLAGGETLRGRTAVIAAGPRAACDLLDLPEAAPLARWAANAVPVRAACLDVALSRLPRPGHRFALGVGRPLYYSLHSAAAKLGPDGVAVIHVMKYLGSGPAAPPRAVEQELEAFLERLQPGWRDHVVARRFLPTMTAASALPAAADGGLAGRPGVAAGDRPNVFLAGDWVGDRGMLADASAASAEEAVRHVLLALRRTPAGTGRRVSHVAV